MFRPIGSSGCLLPDQLPPDVEKVNGAWLFDPCFGQVFDLTGRLLSQPGVMYSLATGERIVSDSEPFLPNPIPPHRYKEDGTLVIGIDDVSTTPEILLSVEELYADLTPTEIAWKAAAFNDIVRVRAAIEDGADVTSNDGRFSDPTASQVLRAAVVYGSAELVQVILSNGAVPGEIDMDLANRLEIPEIRELLEAASER